MTTGRDATVWLDLSAMCDVHQDTVKADASNAGSRNLEDPPENEYTVSASEESTANQPEMWRIINTGLQQAAHVQDRKTL